MNTNSLAAAVALPLLLLAVATPVVAQCPHDSYSSNDTCATAVVLTGGEYTGLVARGATHPLGAEDEWFSICCAAQGEQFVVHVEYDVANHQLEAELYSDSACAGSAVVGVPTAYGLRLDAAGIATGFPPSRYSLLVRSTGTSQCTEYALRYGSEHVRCSPPVAVDDVLEENDSCSTSLSLAPGAYTDLFVSRTDHDYYAVQVPAGEVLTVDMDHDQLTGNALVFLYADDACSVLLDEDTLGMQDRSVQWANTNGVATTVYLKCWASNTFGTDLTCTEYDLHIATTPDPCLAPLVDDGFENNDSCDWSTYLTDGSYSNLFVRSDDPDYYRIDLQPGATLSIQLQFSHAAGDIDARLFSHDAGCAITPLLLESLSGTDDETLTFVNTQGLSSVMLQVFQPSFAEVLCNTYDMTIVGSSPQPSPFCVGDGTILPCACLNNSAVGAGEGCVNSQGHGAALTQSGSWSVAADDLAFTVSNAVPNQTALLVEGSVFVTIPFKDGLLCLGNPTQRLEPLFLDATGSATTTMPLASTTGSLPGDERVYQVWYRDPGSSPCGNGSNFSSAMLVNWR